MKKILMPVDFSEQTEISMQYGLEIVRQFGGEIRLLHCCLDYVAFSGNNFDFSYETEGFLNYERLNSIRKSNTQNMIKIQESLQQEIADEVRTFCSCPKVAVSKRFTVNQAGTLTETMSLI